MDIGKTVRYIALGVSLIAAPLVETGCSYTRITRGPGERRDIKNISFLTAPTIKLNFEHEINATGYNPNIREPVGRRERNADELFEKPVYRQRDDNGFCTE